jgi:hypothetical protein
LAALQGDFYVGVDLGKKEDPTTIAVMRKTIEALRLLGMKVFPLETDYTAVVGYLRVLSDRIHTIHAILIDQTGVGESFVDEAKKAVPNVDGLVLSQPAKQDVMNYLKLIMQQKRLQIPYHLELVNELNVEHFELTKAGQIQYSHPAGTHDDRLWALALAVYATKTTPYPQLKRSHTQWLETTRTAGTSAATRMIRAAMSATERTTRRIQAAIDKGEPLMVAPEDWPHVRHCLHMLAGFYIDTGQAVKAQIALSEVQRLDQKFGFPWKRKKPQP